MTARQVTVPSYLTVAGLIRYLQSFPQDMQVTKDHATAVISTIAVIPGDYGLLTDIS